jgi:HEAT repeat protein
MRISTGCAILAILSTSVVRAGPETPAESQWHRENMAAMKAVMAGSESEEKKFERLAEVMRQESSADHRRDLLALAAARQGPARESFLIGVLQADGDWTIRSGAARLLGRFGSEAAIAPLAKTAAMDAITVGMSGCVGSEGTARREAIFALAELGRRLPTSAKAVTKEISKLPEANNADERLVNESLGDARRQALFQLTQDRTMLAPFFERLTSKDPKIRSQGVVAFRFLKLTKAPVELVALARDPSEDVRSWVSLVLGEIGDVKTVPLLIALAKDTGMDRGTRCNAIGSLGQMRATEAQSPMEALLSDESLKTNAAIALSQITGKRHPLVPEGYGGPNWPANRDSLNR